jgi:acyl carrier protein
MTRRDVLDAMGEIVSLPPGSLRGDEPLTAIPGWDSLCGVTFRVAVQKRWQVSLPGPALSRCETVRDVIALLGSRVTEG